MRHDRILFKDHVARTAHDYALIDRPLFWRVLLSLLIIVTHVTRLRIRNRLGWRWLLGRTAVAFIGEQLFLTAEMIQPFIGHKVGF